MTGHGSVDAARDAFRANAVDFLEKPIDHGKLIGAIEEAFSRQAALRNGDRQIAEFERLLASLTPREAEVMDLVVDGLHNREIAESLGISARTVEVHKARVMAKLRVENVPELVRFSLIGRGAKFPGESLSP
jgi:RNA polymerase sigma factor (sigma-70 family)